MKSAIAVLIVLGSSAHAGASPQSAAAELGAGLGIERGVRFGTGVLALVEAGGLVRRAGDYSNWITVRYERAGDFQIDPPEDSSFNAWRLHVRGDARACRPQRVLCLGAGLGVHAGTWDGSYSSGRLIGASGHAFADVGSRFVGFRLGITARVEDLLGDADEIPGNTHGLQLTLGVRGGW